MARTRDRWLLLILSVGAHVVVLSWLMTHRQPFSRAIEPPTMEVMLMPPLLRRAPLAEPRRAPAKPVKAHVPRSVERAPVVRHDPAVATPDGGATAPAVEPGVRQALRGLLGCRHAALAGLSPEERQRCQDRLGALAEQEASQKLNLDTRGVFARDPDPYLARKPKNGCKARAGGDVAPTGKHGAALGVGCAWAF